MKQNSWLGKCTVCMCMANFGYYAIDETCLLFLIWNANTSQRANMKVKLNQSW